MHTDVMFQLEQKATAKSIPRGKEITAQETGNFLVTILQKRVRNWVQKMNTKLIQVVVFNSPFIVQSGKKQNMFPFDRTIQ